KKIAESGEVVVLDTDFTWKPESILNSTWRQENAAIQKAAVLLDGSECAARALPTAIALHKSTGMELLLLASVKDHTPTLQAQYAETYAVRDTYLRELSADLKAQGIQVVYAIHPGFIADVTAAQIEAREIDLAITSTSGKSGSKHWDRGGVSRKLVQKISTPILLVQADEYGEAPVPTLKRILVALDGSIVSERSLPYAKLLAKTFGAELILTSVPAVPEMSKYRAPAKFVEMLQTKADTNMKKFLKCVSDSLQEEGIRARTIVTGSLPARTILSVSEQEDVDLIMLTSRGRGKLEMLVGSVAQRVVEGSDKPVFMLPVPEPLEEPKFNHVPELLSNAAE
ncbi:MAG: universal stress protein, partial [Anaerolineales bacterium]|nr:universal stress protein [Anaerolineales bacterium]